MEHETAADILRINGLLQDKETSDPFYQHADCFNGTFERPADLVDLPNNESIPLPHMYFLLLQPASLRLYCTGLVMEDLSRASLHWGILLQLEVLLRGRKASVIIFHSSTKRTERHHINRNLNVEF